MPDDDLVALLDRAAAYLGAGRRGPAEVHHRRSPAQDLVDRGGHQPVDVGAERVELIRVVEQRIHAVRGCVAGRLVAGDRQQQHEHVELELGEPVAVDFGVEELGHDVVARVAASLRREVVHVEVQLGDRLAHVVGRVLRVVAADQLVRPLEHESTVFLRDAHDLGDRLQRQLRRDVGDEVRGATLDHVVDDDRRAVTEVLLEQTDHPRREPLVHQQAVARVLGRIHVQHHHAASVGATPVGVVVPDRRAAELRREQLGVAVHVDEVTVLHDIPEAGVATGTGSGCQ